MRIELLSEDKAVTRLEMLSHRPEDHPSLCFFTHQGSSSFYNLKEYLLPVAGSYTHQKDTRHHTNVLNLDTTTAMFDISRGVLPFVSKWQLITALGWVSVEGHHYDPAERIAFNLGSIGDLSQENHVRYRDSIYMFESV